MTRTPEERLAALEERTETFAKDIAVVKHDVREIRDALLTVKGGWKAFAFIFALGSAIGGFATKLFEYIPSLPR